MNMVGHPKHVQKALDVGVDIICAQAGEGGGHTGDIPASILIPACVDAVKGHKSPLTGQPIYVIGAGAVYDGRGLAANLAWGAQAVCTLPLLPSIRLPPLTLFFEKKKKNRGWYSFCRFSRSISSQNPQRTSHQRRIRRRRHHSNLHRSSSPSKEYALRQRLE